MDRTILSILLDDISLEFGLSNTQLGLLSGGVLIVVYALFGFPIAKLSAGGNRRNIIGLTTAVWSLLTLSVAAAQNFWQLMLARFGVGIGESGAVVPAHSIISDLYPAERRTSAMASFVVGANLGVLLAFLVGGQFLLETLGLRLGSFQIAGGIILFVFAMTMIFGESKPLREIEEAERDHLAGAVFPLAMPSIASPGAMLAIVILTDNHTESLADQATTAALLMIVMALTLVLLLAASFVHRIIGNTGASVISRVMGIVLATIAVDSVLGGLDALDVLDIAPPAVENPITQPATG